MNINAKVHPMVPEDIEARRQGVGANALWNGPYNTQGFSKGKGNNAGITGMIFNNDKPMMPCGCPITKKAKGYNNGTY